MHSTHWSTVHGEYKGVLSDDLSSTEYNASYDTEYGLHVGRKHETARRVVRSKFTRQMYRDEDSESTEMQSSMVVFQSSTKRRREPYLLGAVARSDAQLIAMTIDQMVSKANNVPKEEALTVWGLPYKSYDSLGHIRRPISANSIQILRRRHDPFRKRRRRASGRSGERLLQNVETQRMNLSSP
jgi:hypothetical protein